MLMVKINVGWLCLGLRLTDCGFAWQITESRRESFKWADMAYRIPC